MFYYIVHHIYLPHLYQHFYNTLENPGIDRIPYAYGQTIINVSIDTKMNPGRIKFPLL